MSRKSQEEYRKAGLCMLCGLKKPRDGILSCDECSKKRAAYTKQRIEKRIVSGVCVKCGKKVDLVTRRHCLECRNKHNDITKRRTKEIKDIVFSHYGGYKCNCCGETEKDFLALDHINGGGHKHRRSIGCGSGSETYRWILQNNFPPMFQVLCCNCNWGRRFHNGICPHKLKVKDTSSII